MLRVGDEVVCVQSCANAPILTVKGQVYTIAGFTPVGGLLLSGVYNGANGDVPGWWGFRADRFRKVQRRKADLSIESFLTIKPGFEEPRRVTTPTRKRERA